MRPTPTRLARHEHDADDGERHADGLESARSFTGGEVHCNGQACAGSRDRRDDAHDAEREPAVQGRERDGDTQGGERRPDHEFWAGRRVCAHRNGGPDNREPRELGEEDDGQHGDAAALKAADEVARAPGDAREQREPDR